MSLSSASKVTIKNGSSKYDWTQTDESICVYIPIKNVLLKNIDIFYSDCLLKINAVSIKYLVAIDFLHRIDYKDVKNKF